jgi:hypothetical protein
MQLDKVCKVLGKKVSLKQAAVRVRVDKYFDEDLAVFSIHVGFIASGPWEIRRTSITFCRFHSTLIIRLDDRGRGVYQQRKEMGICSVKKAHLKQS